MEENTGLIITLNNYLNTFIVHQFELKENYYE